MKNNRTFLEKLLDGSEVEWKPLKKVCNFISTGKLNANAMDENGIYPFFTCNEKPYKINNYAFDMEAILISGNGSQVGHLNYFKGKFNAYQRTYVIGEFDNNTLVMYLYHYLNFKLRDYITINSKKGSVPYITLPMLEKFEIPIPPLPVQTEIVKILDALTALTSELILRRKQYEYYRETLLLPDNLEQLNTGGAKKKLSDVAIYAKSRISTDKLDKENYIGVENLLQNKLGKTSSNYVPIEGSFIEYLPNDILIGNIRPYLRKIWLADKIGGTNGDVLVIRLTDENILPRYLYHILANEHFFEYNVKYSKGAKMPRGDKAAILQYEFDVPPLEEQHRIVSILDKFETLTNSIIEGLPLAIEQSQKRYEYYRELLLNFS